MSIAQIVITSIITGIGTVAVAANHLAVTAESISYLPASGVAVAGTTLVGQAIGGGRKDLARRFARTVSWMGVVIMTFGGAILFFFAPQLIRIFSTDPEVIDLGSGSWPLQSLSLEHPSWRPAACGAPEIPGDRSSLGCAPCGACGSPCPSCWRDSWGSSAFGWPWPPNFAPAAWCL